MMMMSKMMIQSWFQISYFLADVTNSKFNLVDCSPRETNSGANLIRPSPPCGAIPHQEVDNAPVWRNWHRIKAVTIMQGVKLN